MTIKEFESVIKGAITELPGTIRTKIEKDRVILVIQDKPTRNQGYEHDGIILGLYQGVPLTERGSAQPTFPDRITIFKESIETVSRSRDEMIRLIKETLIHEVGHYLGLDDTELKKMGL